MQPVYITPERGGKSPGDNKSRLSDGNTPSALGKQSDQDVDHEVQRDDLRRRTRSQNSMTMEGAAAPGRGATNVVGSRGSCTGGEVGAWVEVTVLGAW